MLAAEAAFAALHPSAAFVSTASLETFKVTPTEEGEGRCVSVFHLVSFHAPKSSFPILFPLDLHAYLRSLHLVHLHFFVFRFY
jgi:hypothetical protein